MKINVKAHKNKRQHNKGMRNLKQLILKFNIPLHIDFIY